MATVDAERTHYVLSVKWTRGPVVTWWGPNRRGYVQRLTDAGKYTEAEAAEIERSTHGDSVAMPCAVVDAKAAPVVFDFAVGDMIRERQRAHQCALDSCDLSTNNQRAARGEPPRQRCNKHDDCDAAKAKAKAEGRNPYVICCHSDDCEDCFGS